MMGRCVIVGAGEVYSRVSVMPGDFVIAADGGYMHLNKMGIVPDVLIGDFDSISEIPDLEGVEIIRHKVEKDETDMYLAYKIGADRGFDKFYVYGGVGGREDHTFANYCLLLGAIEEGNRVFLMAEKHKSFVIKNEKVKIKSDAGKGISVFAFGSDAEGVSIKGLKYEAENITLKCSYPLGVSNSFKENSDAEISVLNGALLIMQEI